MDSFEKGNGANRLAGAARAGDEPDAAARSGKGGGPGQPGFVSPCATWVCLAVGENRLAENYVREALRLRDDPQLWRRLGQALFLQGNLAEAETAYRHALEGAPSSAETWSDLAALMARRNRPEEAVVLLRRALSFDPQGQIGGRILRNLAVYEWKTGQRDAALEHLRQAVTVLETAFGTGHPDLAQALTDYSEALAMTGHKREARATAERAAAMRSGFGGTRTIDWRELTSRR